MKKLLMALTAGALMTGSASFALDLNDPEEIVTARHGYMLMMAMSLAPLGAMAKGQAPYDAAQAKTAAGNLAALASLDAAMVWVDGTDAATTEDSFALPEAFANPDLRAEKQAALKAAAIELASAAGSDVAALKTGMAAVGAACSDCHKLYRKPESE